MKRPVVNIWVYIYFLLGLLPVLFLCIWALRDGWFPTENILAKHPDPADNFYLFNKTLTVITAGMTLIASAPIWILVFGKRRSWVWMTTLIFIALGISGNPFMGIPVLIFWVKEDNKAYYGKL